MKYRFNKIKLAEDLLKAIGREDIPLNKVVLYQPAVDRETGDVLADFELEIPDDYSLIPTDEGKLDALMMSKGYRRVKE